jgi:hypothetical protein
LLQDLKEKTWDERGEGLMSVAEICLPSWLPLVKSAHEPRSPPADIGVENIDEEEVDQLLAMVSYAFQLHVFIS